MNSLVVSLLLAALLLAARLPDSKAIIVLETGGSQVGPYVCPGPCRCGLLNNGAQQRAGPGSGSGEGEGAGDGELSRRRRFATAGERVRANLYPWLAAVTRLAPYSGYNAAALVSDRHVLTAASAVAGVPLGSLRVTLSVGGMCGTPDSTAINMSVAEVSSLSGSFTSDVDGDDLALLRLSNPVRFSTTLSPVCLPPNERAIYTGRNAMVVGFGGNATEPLDADDTANATVTSGFPRRCRPRALLQPVVSSRDCATAASSTSASGRVSTTGCVGSPGGPQVVCPSDAGSLIQVRGTRGEVQLIGIMTSTNNCTEGETGPAQFTLTAPNLRWLLRRTAGSCFCAAP